MKKTVFLAVILILAVAVIGCPGTGKEPEDEKTLDARLLDGFWLHPSMPLGGPIGMNISRGYFYFELYYDNPMINTYRTPLQEMYTVGYSGYQFTCYVYSKDGIIYRADDDLKLMRYEFTNIWPYPNDNYYGLSTEHRAELDEIAAGGDIITYSLFNEDGTLLDDGRTQWSWALVRFDSREPD